ncbi:MAG: ribonuclease H-like domain-containing protein [Armatimonadetes bacterium]|nr:ribonuclease H-like domain-containing protein [Armatimonadota bacterium]
MLTSTFIHAPGVGPATERSLWGQGANDWWAFLEAGKRLRVPPRHRAALVETVEQSVAHLEAARADWFARRLPKKEHWRAVSAFPKVGFLDIETDGGFSPDSLTVIGLSDGSETHAYLKGRDLARFAFDCQDYDGFVTFFGTGFDLPFLKRRFPVLENVFAGRFHVDLCPLLKRLGHTGGLKSIERQLGIPRVPETDGLTGYDAVRLWRAYRKGGRGADDALRLLLAYNREDVVNMKLLLDYALPRLRAASGYNVLETDAVKGA